MSDRIIGKFGRAWNGDRPKDGGGYAYGFCVRVIYGCKWPFRMTDGELYKCFEPAESEPTFPDPPRRLIKDRARLAQVLLDGGWVPDADGSFVRPSKNDFVPEMWKCCGGEVYYRNGNFLLKTAHAIWTIAHEWTEPDDD